MAAPARGDPGTALERLRADMKVVEENPLRKRWGWVIEPDYGSLRLGVTMWALDERGRRLEGHDYHVSLDMSRYPEYPPGVTFVNPATGSFDPDSDMRWLPRWDGSPPDIKACCDPRAGIDGYKKAQVIRNTMILEYYLAGADLASAHAWSRDRHTFFATLHVLQRLLARPYYGGRSR